MLVYNIEALCKEHGISVSRLERELDISIGTIRTWRKRSPNLSTLLKVTTYFHVSIDQLLRTDVHEPPKTSKKRKRAPAGEGSTSEGR